MCLDFPMFPSIKPYDGSVPLVYLRLSVSDLRQHRPSLYVSPNQISLAVRFDGTEWPTPVA